MNEKKRIKAFSKRILSFVLTMAMMITLMPMMSAEVKADDWQVETINGGTDGVTSGVYFKVSAGVISDCEEGEWNLSSPSYPISISNINGNSYIIKKLEIFGVDTDSGQTSDDFSTDNESAIISFENELLTITNINASSIQISLSRGNAYPNGVAIYYTAAPHSHSWAYAADGATLYAYCTSEEGCDYQGSATDLSKAITLTLTKARTDTNFTGLPNTALFDYDEADAWEAATGESAPTITYEAKSGSVLTNFEGEMCAVKIGSYTAKATIGSATATLDFEVTRKEHSEVVDKVIDFDETDWSYCFYVDGTYTSDVTGDAVGDVSSLRFYNISDEMVSYVAPIPLGKTLIGGHSEKVDIATISLLTSGTQNAVGIECEYDATAHTLTITPIYAAVIHKDTNDFEVTSDSVSKTFTQGQTSASTIHIAGLKIDNMNKEGDVYKGILVMNGETVLVQGTDYTVTEGSVKVNLTKSYLDTLSVGTHNIKVYVKQNGVATATDKDYEFDASVIINAKSNPTPTPEPTPETPSRPIYKAPNTSVR